MPRAVAEPIRHYSSYSHRVLRGERQARAGGATRGGHQEEPGQSHRQGLVQGEDERSRDENSRRPVQEIPDSLHQEEAAQGEVGWSRDKKTGRPAGQSPEERGQDDLGQGQDGAGTPVRAEPGQVGSDGLDPLDVDCVGPNLADMASPSRPANPLDWKMVVIEELGSIREPFFVRV